MAYTQSADQGRNGQPCSRSNKLIRENNNAGQEKHDHNRGASHGGIVGVCCPTGSHDSKQRSRLR